MFRVDYSISGYVFIWSEKYEDMFPVIIPNQRIGFYTFRFDICDQSNETLRMWLQLEEERQ